MEYLEQHQMEIEKLKLELDLVKAKCELTKGHSGQASLTEWTATHFKDVLHEVLRTVSIARMPVIEPALLTGKENPIDYRLWRNTFAVLVENRGLSSIEKMLYLMKYSDGEAKQCIKGYALVGTEDAYQQALNKLDERYGNKFLTSDHVIDTLCDWKKIQNKPKEWRKFSDYLSQCELLKEQNDDYSELEYLDYRTMVYKLASKIPYEQYDEWLRKAYKFKQENDRYPGFSELVKFVDFETEIACSLHTSNQVQTDSESETQSDTLGETSNHPDNDPVCFYCNSENHHLRNCSKFRKRKFGWRLWYIKSQDLCFKCHEPTHYKTSCKAIYNCDKCNDPHPTSMHRVNNSAHQVTSNNIV